MHHFAIGLQKLGHSVAVLSQLKDSGWIGIRNKLHRRFTKAACPSDSKMGYPTYRGWDLSQGIRDLAIQFRPEVVVVTGIGSKIVPLAAQASSLGIPIVYSVMDVAFKHHGGPLTDLAEARFIANSNFTSQRLLDLYGISSIVIRPPINVNGCKVANGGKKIVMVNPQPSKGGLIALALAEARSDIPFVFYEAWSGDISEIKKRAKRAGNIEWRGPVMDRRKVYEEARVVLMPSQAEEAWGMVASEAQCSGIPVIGSDIGGLTEAIGAGGIKVAPDAPITEWLNAVQRLWSDQAEWLRISQAALNHSKRDEIQLQTQISKLDDFLKLTPSISL